MMTDKRMENGLNSDDKYILHLFTERKEVFDASKPDCIPNLQEIEKKH